MVYYGPWEQLDDYERPGVMLAWDDGTAGGVGAEFQDDPQSPRLPLTGSDADDMNARLEEANAAPLDSSPSYPTVAIRGYLPGFARPENGWKVSNGATRIGPRDGVLDAPTWMVPHWFEWPDGATGYEFAEQRGVVVAAALEFGSVAPSGAENNYSDTDSDGNRAADGQWDLAIMVRGDQGIVPRDYGGSAIASWTYPGSVLPVSGTFDVTGLAAANEGRFILLGDANASVSVFDIDEAGYWGCSLDIAVREVLGTGSPGYGEFAVRYTIRPPLFRWVYERPPLTSAPPLRQFPRDDNLATSSAARVWSSSRQGSLRRHGYH